MVSEYLDNILSPVAGLMGISPEDLSETLYTEFVGEGVDSLLDLTLRPFGIRLIKGLFSVGGYLSLIFGPYVASGLSKLGIPLPSIDSRTKREIMKMATHLGTQAVEYDPNVGYAIQQGFAFGEGIVELDVNKLVSTLVKTPEEIEAELAGVRAALGSLGVKFPDATGIITDTIKKLTGSFATGAGSSAAQGGSAFQSSPQQIEAAIMEDHREAITTPEAAITI